MQTFLPYPDFNLSATVLDYRRLGKQRVEAWQILNTLRGASKGKGWINHPAVKMWRGHEQALVQYGIAMCKEWINRGYKDTMLERFMSLRSDTSEIVLPKWHGNEEFHRSHRSNLLRKKPDFYRVHWPKENDNLQYVWPI